LESIDLPDQSSANLSITVLSVGGGFQKLNKKKNASWGINYGYSNLDLAFAVIKQQQEYTKTPGGHYADANFRIKTSKNGMLKYYGYMTTNKIAFTVNSLDTPGYRDRFLLKNINHYHNLSWKEQFKNKWKINIGLSASNNRDDYEFALTDANKKELVLSNFEFKNFDLENRGLYANAKLVLEKRFKGLNAFRFGTEYNHSSDKINFIAFNGMKFPSTIQENVYSLFAEQDVYITNNLAGKFGVRAERSELLNRNNIAPRLSLAYKVGKQAQASVAYGQFFQNPELRNLPAVNPLAFQKATHYIAQYQKTTSLTTFRAEVFYKKYDNLIKTVIVNNQQRAGNNNGFGDAKGFEFFWRDKKTIKNLDYWISYSYLDTKRDFANFPFAITPNFAAKHTASLVVKKFVSDWKSNINFSYNYASSRPYYNIQPDANNAGKFMFADRGKVDPYHNVSFSVNYLPKIGKKDAKSFVVYVLSVSNVFNFKQQFGYNYSYNGLRKQEIVPPSRMFVFLGAFFSFGVDRSEDAININL
jgi:vitamin B12 transporter